MTHQTLAPQQRTWMTPEQASQYCGVHVTTLWRARQRGELRAGGVGRAVRFERAELDRWLRRAG